MDKEAAKQLEIEDAMKAHQQEEVESKARKGNTAYTLAWIAITVIILFQGINAYSSRGYMEFFGIRLEEGQFYLLIGVLLIINVFSLRNIFKKKSEK